MDEGPQKRESQQRVCHPVRHECGQQGVQTGKAVLGPWPVPDKQWKQRGFSQGMTTSHQCLGDHTGC